MKLTKLVLSNYRSIAGTREVALDNRVTALLGSNDHGKSNVLAAITHLNDDLPITPDDVNWNAEGDSKVALHYHFELSEDERQSIHKHISAIREEHRTGTWLDLIVKGVDALLAGARKHLVLSRVGVGAPLSVNFSVAVPHSSDPGGEEFEKRLIAMKPRVELFRPQQSSLPDRAQAGTIRDDSMEFMQGVFFLAGLDPFNSDAVFEHNDRTVKRLEQCSRKLNEELKKQWSQGRELNLEFQLRHGQGTIELYADDPAVPSRKVRISQRSTGVTQFFRLAMMLEARRRKSPSKSYVYLFDEPGTHLHPQGQRDLIQVFESFADDFQVVYATHSIFLLNHNFPERHRLVLKDTQGTQIDQKGARANWRHAVDAMGITLPPTVFFCDRILFVEGDSDAIFLYELLRQINSMGTLSVDANYLGVLSFADEHELRFLVQRFRNMPMRRRGLCLMTDGDGDGKRYGKVFTDLVGPEGGTHIPLDSACSIEDYCMWPETYIEAVIQATQSIGAGLDATKRTALEVELRQSLAHKPTDITMGRHCSTVVKKAFAKEGVSKPTVARIYAEICRERNADTPTSNTESRERAMRMVKSLVAALAIPETRASHVAVETA